MKITYLDFDDIKNPLLGAGQAHATFEVASRLVRKGHQVEVLSAKFPGYKDRRQSKIFYKHIGIPTPFIRLNNLIYILTLPFYVPRIKSDIIIECFTAPISTLFSPLFTNIPVIALPSMFNAKEFRKKYKLPFDWVEKFGLKFYKYILPYSETDSAKAKLLNKNINYKIVGQGVSKVYFKIKKTNPEHILFLSRFDMEQKGIDLLLEAYSKVKNKINFPLVLAGHGPDEQKIKDLVKKLNIEDKVTFAGSAYGNKKYKLMSKAKFVVFPSRHDEMCLWALEALAAGLPLVCFDLPESRWIKDEVSFKAKPFSVKDYSIILLKAANNKLIDEKSVNAKKFAKKFSWENVAFEFDSYFKFVIKSEKKIKQTLALI